jgi:CO/xanthine dehydrogenase FAD-binding subunit
MTFWNHYYRPHTVEEAVDCLGSTAGPTAVVAGGTDLLLDLRQGRHVPVDALIDVTLVDEMCRISLENGHIYIGASTTHQAIVGHPLLQAHAQALVEGCGNVAHALPAADGTIALLALDAEAELASVHQRRRLPITDLFIGPGETSFDRHCELIVGFRIPIRHDHEGSAFQRVMRPQGVAIAILNMGGWMRLTPEGRIEDFRLAVGPAGPRPFRSLMTEGFVRGRRLDRDTIAQAGEILLEEVHLRTSPHRASKSYRSQLVPVLLKRTLDAAFARAMSGEIAGQGEGILG